MPLRRRAAAFVAFAVRKTVGAGLLALAGAAVLGGTGAGPASWVASASAAVLVPDPVFSGTLTAAQQAEMMAWGQAYFNKIEGVNQGGSNAVATAWTFATPAMNSPLFNPFYGPRQTLVNLGLIDDTDCMKAITETPGTDRSALKKRSAIKDALVSFKFKTDPVTDPNGTTTHVYKILDAALVAGLVTYTEGGKLVSEKLPLDIIIAAGAEPQFVDTISLDTINAINAIVVAAPGYAQTAIGGNEAQKMLTGGTSRADNIRTKIMQLLTDLQVEGSDSEQGEITFAVYGALPVIHVALLDADLMVDAVTGAVVGPLVKGSAPPIATLLLAHAEYTSGTGGRYLTTSFGCQVVALPFWHDKGNPPPFWNVPAPGVTPYKKVNLPGVSPTSWTCLTTFPRPLNRWRNPFPTLLSCNCEQDTDYSIPGPPVVNLKVKKVCNYLGSCWQNPMTPSTPTTLLPGSPPTQTTTCADYFWY